MNTAVAKPSARLKTFADVLTRWLTDLARIHSLGRREEVVITEQDFALYGDALSDLTPDQLDAAFLRASRVCRFFPTPADIRSQVEDTNLKVSQLEADNAWQRVIEWIQCWYHPDIGVSKRAPNLKEAVKHAIIAAGGFDYLFNCCGEKEQWAKKRFLESYKNIHELGEVEHLLGDGEAKQILKQLASEPHKTERKQLTPPPAHAVKENLSDAQVRALTDQALKRPPAPVVEMTTEQEERRIQELRRQAALLGHPRPRILDG
jgi:hypothetical protein